MKIFEIITESSKTDTDKNNDGIPDSHQTATPGLRSHPKLDNSSPYHPWRFAAHFVGGADGVNEYEHEPSRDGPNGQALITVSYTDEERKMLDQAQKKFGWEANHVDLSPEGSTEIKEINRASPVRRVGAITRRSK